jgi:hypothetical protein
VPWLPRLALNTTKIRILIMISKTTNECHQSHDVFNKVTMHVPRCWAQVMEIRTRAFTSDMKWWSNHHLDRELPIDMPPKFPSYASLTLAYRWQSSHLRPHHIYRQGASHVGVHIWPLPLHTGVKNLQHPSRTWSHYPNVAASFVW